MLGTARVKKAGGSESFFASGRMLTQPRGTEQPPIAGAAMRQCDCGAKGKSLASVPVQALGREFIVVEDRLTRD
jgi:hypothetical protein